MTWHDFRLRLNALLRLKRAEADLEEELRFHMEMEARKHIAAGLSEPEAFRLASRQFGGLDLHKEDCRDARGTQWIESTLRDLRYACRGFARTPGFALTVIGTIGLALSLNTTVFTIFNAYVLRPLAVRDPDSLYRFTWTNRAGNDHRFTPAQFQSLQANGPFAEVAALSNLVTRVDGRALSGVLVSGNYFEMLGVRMLLGRPILRDDRGPVVVLSHAAWQNHFGGATDIIGRRMVVRETALDIIGVLPPEFAGLDESPRDFWAPLTVANLMQSNDSTPVPRLNVIGRLKHGMNLEATRTALLSWTQAQTAHLGESERAFAVFLHSQATPVPLTWQAMAGLSPIFVAFGLVLVIACVNVANMMLSRTLSREREIGIRLSLGAARGRLVRQLLTECTVLAIPAAACGFLLSRFAIHYGQMLMFWTLPVEVIEFIRIVPLTPDLRVFLFMLAAAGASTVLFGLAPAMQATRVSHGHRSARLRSWLIVSQVACCVLLLICSGVLLRAAMRAQQIDTGVQTKGVVLMELKDSLRQRVLDTLAREPMVLSTGSAASIPLNGSLATTTIVSSDGSRLRAAYNLVSPEYFSILEIPLLRGRYFTAEESRTSAPVAIVSRSTATRLFGNADPLGRVLRLGDRDDTYKDKRLYRYSGEVRIVGVAGDVVCESIFATNASPCVYFPSSPLMPGASVFVKVNQEDEAARRHLDTVLASTAPGAVEQNFKLSSFLAANIYPFRAASWVCGAIGALALLLTLSGVYGVLSYLVTQRTREIGIRVALGATRASVIGIVLKQSFRYCVRGSAIGTALALALSHLLATRLVVLNPMDPVAYGLGILCVVGAALTAAYFPSRRAARIDPAFTLRSD